MHGTVQIAVGALSILSVSNDTKANKCDGAMTVAGGFGQRDGAGAQGKGIKATDLTLDGARCCSAVGRRGAGDGHQRDHQRQRRSRRNVYVDPSLHLARRQVRRQRDDQRGRDHGDPLRDGGKGVSADGDVTINGGALDQYTTGGNSAAFTNDEGLAGRGGGRTA
jgi:hypothetical protein